MKTNGKILSLMFAAQLAASCASSSDVNVAMACPSVESIKTMPFRDERGVDGAYDRLRFDDSCEEMLISALSSTQKMADPRQMPPDERFVVADAALFVLLERRGIEVEAVVPEEVSKRMESQGIYAYFDYVASPAGRDRVTSKVRQLVNR